MINLRTLAIALVATATATTAFADDKKYTIADLKALVSQKSYREALTHAADIPPASRTAEWIDVTATAAGGLLATIDGEGAAIGLIDEIDREYPALIKNAKYAKPRAEQGYKGLEACYSSRYSVDHCMKVTQRFIDNSSDPALTLKVAKLARKSMNAQGAVPFFEKAIAGNKAACKDEDATLAVVAGLGLPADSPNMTKSKALLAICYDAMKVEVLKAFDASPDGYFGKNTCDFLKSKNAISGLQAKKCARK